MIRRRRRTFVSISVVPSIKEIPVYFKEAQQLDKALLNRSRLTVFRARGTIRSSRGGT